MTFWNKVYLHHYGYGSVWHVFQRKLARLHGSWARSLNRAIGINPSMLRKLRQRNKLEKQSASKRCQNGQKKSGRFLASNNWKQYGVDVTVKYG